MNQEHLMGMRVKKSDHDSNENDVDPNNNDANNIDENVIP